MTRDNRQAMGDSSRSMTASHVPVRRKIATRLGLGFTLAALVPALAAGYVSFRIAENSMKTDMLDALMAATETRSTTIEMFAHERRMDATTLSRDPEIARAVDRFTRIFREHGIDSPEFRAADREFGPFLRYVQESGYYDLFLISPKGDVVYTVAREKDLGTNLVSGPFSETQLGRVFDRANTLLETEVSDFEPYGPSRKPASFVAAPILARDGLVGSVALQIDTDRIYQLATDYTGLGDTGEIVIASLVDGNAVVMAPLRHDRGAAFKRSWKLGSPKAKPMQEAVMARKGGGTSVDYRGKDVLAAWRYVPSFRWGLVVKVDASEAYAPIADLRLWWAIIALASALIMALAARFLSRTVSIPIRKLARVSRRIAGGDLSARADIRKTDEVGQLATVFNRMATQLEGNQRDLKTYSEDLEQMVEERTAELQRSNDELEQFAYVASHDLQEPLRMVASYTELLGRRYEGRLDEDADKFIGYAVDGSRRMQGLITDMLDYSRVTTRGKVFEPVDLDSVLADTLTNLKLVLKETGAEVTHDPLPTLSADATQMSQLFQNLIGNALKFRGENPPRIHVSAAAQGNVWLLSISDNGMGMEPQYLERIFVMFQRLHPRGKHPGTGIGLAVSRKIVERHGGRIWAESEPGKGTTFKFTLGNKGGRNGRERSNGEHPAGGGQPG